MSILKLSLSFFPPYPLVIFPPLRSNLQADLSLLPSPFFYRYQLAATSFLPLPLPSLHSLFPLPLVSALPPLPLLASPPSPPILVLHAHHGAVLGDLPPSDAFLLGGRHSVRGFAAGEVAACRAFVEVGTVAVRSPSPSDAPLLPLPLSHDFPLALLPPPFLLLSPPQLSAELRVPLVSDLSLFIFSDFASDLRSSASLTRNPHHSLSLSSSLRKPGSALSHGLGLAWGPAAVEVAVSPALHRTEIGIRFGERY